MASKKNNDLDSPELVKMGKKVTWLQEKAAGAEDLVTKIINLKDASRDLNIKADLKSLQQNDLAGYSEEAVMRCAQELKGFREELKKIDDELRFLPADEVAAKNRHYSLGVELRASEKKWRELQRKLEAAFAREKKAKAEAEEIEEKNKELARQQQLAAKKEALLEKIEMSRGLVTGKSAGADSAVDSNESN
jgi:chromosome segregation ATPase